MILIILLVFAALTAIVYRATRRQSQPGRRPDEPVQPSPAPDSTNRPVSEIAVPLPPMPRFADGTRLAHTPEPPLFASLPAMVHPTGPCADVPAAPARADTRRVVRSPDLAKGTPPAAEPALGGPGREIASPLFSGLAPDVPDQLDDIGRLDVSIGLLKRTSPDLSASPTLTRRQIRGLLIAASGLAGGLLLFGHNVLIVVVIAPAIVAYLAVLTLRLVLFQRSLDAPRTVTITDDEALAVQDWRLPVYSVLVPAFQEPEVMDRLVAQLRAMCYPRKRLDVKLLLEADDTDTIEAAKRAIGADDEGFEVVMVPVADPRTKPKALNYGLTTARGQLLTIYDVEDRPDPLQLRKAAVALARLPESVVCLQAKLRYFNPQQNLITRWFAIEYQMWFAQLLPGLVDFDAPIPLGGTSNHFRRKVLADVGAWDPFNVTEDADLGVRLHRLGYRTGVLDSVTYEEANSDFVNWVRQRSRWYKGYLQTWLVAMRHPRRLLQDLGWKAFILFNLFVGGTPLLAILNPVFWVMTVLWFVTRSSLILSLFPAPVYYTGLLCWLGGNFLFVFATMLTAFDSDEPKMVFAAAISPLYWVMMSIAATKALLQIVISPSYWEKTIHGLDEPVRPRRPDPLPGTVNS